MSIKEDLKILLVKENLTLAKLSKIVSAKTNKTLTSNSISHKLASSSMKYDEVQEIVEALGYKIKFEKE